MKLELIGNISRHPLPNGTATSSALRSSFRAWSKEQALVVISTAWRSILYYRRLGSFGNR